MAIKRVLGLSLLLLLPIFLWGCGWQTADQGEDERPIYIDENGAYDFGPMGASELNGPNGIPAMYDWPDEKLYEWLDEEDFEPGVGVTLESARRDFKYSMISLAQRSDQD